MNGRKKAQEAQEAQERKQIRIQIKIFLGFVFLFFVPFVLLCGK
jgi:hypothetical protein